jgi:deoxycytidylate deaminase
MENSVSFLDTYPYDSLSKKISQRIIKKVINIENSEEEITKHHILMENTATDGICIDK